MEKNPGFDPDEPLDPTAAAFGDGLPDPFDPDTNEDDPLAIDKVIDNIQGPDPADPQHTFLHDV